jgi:hypothetical protein
MRYWLYALALALVAVVSTGCDSPKVSGSTAPLTDEEKRKIAEQDRQIEEEESPGNKTRRTKKK